MKQDCTKSHSTAHETNCLQAMGSNEFPQGKLFSEPGALAGSAIKLCPEVNGSSESANNQKVVEKWQNSDSIRGIEKYGSTSWSYIFVHNQKVKYIEQLLKKDGITHFIHKTIKYVPRHRNRGGMREVEAPSVSGLIFLQGHPKRLQDYLNANVSPYRLCKNCSTGQVATIPCSQMEPFMRIAETEPERLRFLLRPFVYYSRNRTLLRITTGDYAGLEGYVIRIARDRKLVMDVGGMAVAIAGVHAERFEEVHKNEDDKLSRATFYKRNLHERNAFIDRYFHQVKTAQEVEAQVENIDILRLQTLKDVVDKKLDMKDAFDTFYFMIEEIGYYYAPFIHLFKEHLAPIFDAGRKVMGEIEKSIRWFEQGGDKELCQRSETEYEELKSKYGYLFE